MKVILEYRKSKTQTDQPYYAVLKTSNGRIIFTSEMYKNKPTRLYEILMGMWKVVEKDLT